ncbi:MAG: VanZ family protein [bacterium]|nr:VanZ family protein [bacterium]
MKAVKFTLIYWLPVFLWSALIFWFSSVPGLESGLEVKTDFALRKLAHLAEYGILAILWIRALTAAGLPRRRAFLFSILFCVAFAISDEIHQLYVPGREGKIYDVLIDAAGVILGAYIPEFWKTRRY